MADKIKSMLQKAAVIVYDGIAYQIQYCEDNYMLGVDEETGEDVQIEYDSVDLNRDLIYKLELMNK
jgi:hypothetical protein